MYRFIFMVLFLIALLASGCSSGGGNSVLDTGLTSPEGSLDHGSMPIIGLTDTDNAFDAIGIMGAYDLTFNPVDSTFDLAPIRTGAIGESYIVSGISFFNVTPCVDCLNLTGVSFSSGAVTATFSIRHPFDPGDPSQPPTARNRLDLDIFDLAMVIVPKSATSTNYSLTNAKIYPGLVANADGFTRELSNLIVKQEAMPYVLVVDDSVSPPPTIHYNEFPMGGNTTFDVSFWLSPGTSLTFDLYLTMGYGSSAKRPQRLTPKYYNPEFNRKAAWKVTAEADGFWVTNDATTQVDVEVKVYDWQIGATVDATLVSQTSVYAKSEVDTVTVEIPGMSTALPSVDGDAEESGTGSPSDPLVYTVPIANENMIAVGDYWGLVKVTDTRVTKDPPPAGDRDFLVHKPGELALVNYKMPEYATYQTFTATVIAPPDWHGGGSWNLPVGPCTLDFGIISNTGDAYVVNTDLTMQCTQIWKYPGWANPPVFYASLVNLDPPIPLFQPYPVVRLDATKDGALGWTNSKTVQWLMVGPSNVLNAHTYCNFDKNKNFVTNPQPDDHRHYMIDPASLAPLFPVDSCDTSEGYQCALYVETGFGKVGFQGIKGSDQGADYTDADIKWEAIFPAPFVGVGPGKVDPADVSGIDCRVEGNMIIVYIALKVNRRIEVFSINDVGPGPVDVVTPLFSFPVQMLTVALPCQPIDCELLPPHPNFQVPNIPALCVLIDNTAFPNPPPGIGGSIVIYNGLNGAIVDQIGDAITPGVPNQPKYIDTNESEFSIHVMQIGPKVSKIDYF